MSLNQESLPQKKTVQAVRLYPKQHSLLSKGFPPKNTRERGHPKMASYRLLPPDTLTCLKACCTWRICQLLPCRILSNTRTQALPTHQRSKGTDHQARVVLLPSPQKTRVALQDVLRCPISLHHGLKTCPSQALATPPLAGRAKTLMLMRQDLKFQRLCCLVLK